MTEADYPLCRNPAYAHRCHPHYAKKYDGYCLDCSNAGVPDLLAERDHLRAFLRWEPDPSLWAWCCFCQESHPIDRPHVDGAESKARMDWRARASAEIRGLKAEIERLAHGDFTDKSITMLVEQNDRQVERLKRYRETVTALHSERDALWAELQTSFTEAAVLTGRIGELARQVVELQGERDG